jgi:hypothetical protein
MSISYNSLTGIQGDPLTYISELASSGRKDLDSASVTTRIIILITFIVVMILYYILFSSLGNNGGGGEGSGSGAESGGKRTLEIILWSIFVILLIINGFQYFFNVNVTAAIKDVFTDKPRVDITVQKPPSEDVVPELKIEKEVYNIPDNRYTYTDAKAICQAYGADLASYNQVEQAYNKGAEWCNYGWSDDQMALFPTQKKTWDRLQTIEGHENDCGRPGINGGHISNPNVRFGVNVMQNTPIHPVSMKDIKLQEKVDYWKKRIPEILISPFNKNSWSILG